MTSKYDYPYGSGTTWTFGDSPMANITRRTTVGAILVAVIIIGAIWQATTLKVDNGFTQFVPTAELFPAPPVPDAVSTLGTGRPISWPDWFSCTSSMGGNSSFSRGWQSLRHDWTENGERRSWIISERAVGFSDLAQFDHYLDCFRDEVTYSGWTYRGGSTFGGHNAVLTELNGLPSQAFAFKIDAAPENQNQPDLYGPTNPDDFHALGAVLPGRQRGQLMLVSWIGWGADVATDEFVAAATRLLDAAENAPATNGIVYDSANPPSDLYRSHQFVGYDPGPNLVPPLKGGSDMPLETEVVGGDYLAAEECWGDHFTNEISRETVISDDGAWEQVESRSPNASRSVIFATTRPSSDSSYRQAADRFKRWTGVPCVDTRQNNSVIIEPIELPGLPAGTIVSKWHQADDALVAVLTHDETHGIMVVAWQELPGPVPTEDFVRVVNQAWTEFDG